LAGLVIKSLAKPLSKRIKHDFSRYQVTQNLLVGIGQASHSITSRMTIWSAGYRVRSITPLEREKAISLGAEITGEVFLLGVSGFWLVWEYDRGKEKERTKEEERRANSKQERDALQAKLNALNVRLKALEVVVKTNSRSLLNLGERYVPPNSKDIVPIEDNDAEHAQNEKATDKSSLPQTQASDPPSKTWLRWPWR
jgi:hypothetical protein